MAPSIDRGSRQGTKRNDRFVRMMLILGSDMKVRRLRISVPLIEV